MGAGKDHVEFVTQGAWGAVRTVAKLVGDVPSGCRGERIGGQGGRCPGIVRGVGV